MEFLCFPHEKRTKSKMHLSFFVWSFYCPLCGSQPGDANICKTADMNVCFLDIYLGRRGDRAHGKHFCQIIQMYDGWEMSTQILWALQMSAGTQRNTLKHTVTSSMAGDCRTSPVCVLINAKTILSK